MFQLDELSPSHWPNPPPPTGHATGDSRVVENIAWTLFTVGLKSTRHINGSRKPLDFNKPWSCYGFLTCSYLKLFEIALSPPLINRNSVQNHLNDPTEPQPITDSCHNNSLPANPSSLPTSNHYCSSITGPANVISLCPTQFLCILTPTRPMHHYEDQLLTTRIGLFTT